MAVEKESTETLLERSQRILGFSLDSPDPEDPSAQAGNSNGSNDRRKAQVSQAQRTHRRRTQRYIRELEQEVLRVRSREKKALERIKALEKQLRSNNIDPQPTYDAIANGRSPNSSVADIEDSGFHLPTGFSPSSNDGSQSQSINIDLTPLISTNPEYACCDTAASKPAPDIGFLSEIPNQIDRTRTQRSLERIQSGATQTGVADAPVDLDAQAAVDFILQLERPCLPHVRFAVEHHGCRIPSKPYLDNEGGPDHVFTATRGFLSARPTQNGVETNAGPPLKLGQRAKSQPMQPFSLSQQQVDDLLAASARLDLEDELTPVQVWKRIVDTAAANQTQRVGRAFLEDMTEAFRGYSFCNSYGSVCHKVVVDIVMGCFFPVYIRHFNSPIVEAPP